MPIINLEDCSEYKAEIARLNSLCVLAYEALDIFYGSGWHYNDYEIDQIEAARDTLKQHIDGQQK